MIVLRPQPCGAPDGLTAMFKNAQIFNWLGLPSCPFLSGRSFVALWNLAFIAVGSGCPLIEGTRERRVTRKPPSDRSGCPWIEGTRELDPTLANPEKWK